jgi:GMP synthase-like glutamine amidotransferase
MPASASRIEVMVFQHAAGESMGIFEEIFSEQGIPFEYVRLYETGEVPVEIHASHLIFMGGPMSVNDEREFSWLAEEKALIRDLVRQGRPVLGICLGAQLIASAHGARVYRSTAEYGWCGIRKVGEGPFARFPAIFSVFQFHGETFDVPHGGTIFCTGDQVKNQAFMLGSALAIQFHLELTRSLIRDWTRDLPAAQQAAIEAGTPKYLERSNALCRMLAEDFFK